jgi:signal transduction histidine kinase
MPLMQKRKIWHFKLRTILLIVNLVLLLLPLGGILFFRIYENELVKQTELELISQSALIASLYKTEVGRLLDAKGISPTYGVKAAVPWTTDEPYRPVNPQLTLSSRQILPRPEAGTTTDAQADAFGVAAGTKLAPILADAQRTTLSGIRILDYHGVAVMGGVDVGLSFAHLDEVRQALSGRYVSVLRERVLKHPVPALASISRGTGLRVFTAFPIFKEDRLIGVVLLSRTPRSILQDLYSERDTVTLIATGLILLAVGLAIFISYTIARPIHALIRQTRGIAGGDKAALEPLKSPVTEELALLSQSFSEMARSLEYRSEYIRNFATQVSHEFKTPLAGIRGAVELLQEHIADMPAEKRDRFLRNIKDDSNRLQRLVERLLEMARADVLAAAPATTDITPLLAQLTERYKDLGLTVSVAGADTHMKARIAPEILETVFSNLLDNSRQNGADRVAISHGLVDGVWSVTVADNGKGISPANSDKIFSPFFTTHRDEGGTGLGLGIVKSLLKAYGGDISLRASEKGAVFVVSIPDATP